MAVKKERLDKLVQERFPHLTRAQVQGFIMQGKVKVDNKVSTKSGVLFNPLVEVALDEEIPRFVSRAGLKLEKALEHFGVNVMEKVALDAGLSTGGFTDCLLQKGIAKVYGVDVGYGQVHESIARNPRVIVMERTNIRNLESLPEMVDVVTLDLSFISVLKVIERVVTFMKPGAELIVLIKPQFEAERKDIARGGVVKDPLVHKKVVEKMTEGISAAGLAFHGVIDSPILGGTSGNKEMLAYFTKSLM